VFRLHEAAIIRTYVLENLRINYIALAIHMIIKSMAEISP